MGCEATEAAAAVGLLQTQDERIGVNERSARCTTGFAAPIRANPEDGCEFGRGRRRASGDGKGGSCRRSAVTAS